jgi:hypothetical protein
LCTHPFSSCQLNLADKILFLPLTACQVGTIYRAPTKPREARGGARQRLILQNDPAICGSKAPGLLKIASAIG